MEFDQYLAPSPFVTRAGGAPFSADPVADAVARDLARASTAPSVDGGSPTRFATPVATPHRTPTRDFASTAPFVPGAAGAAAAAVAPAEPSVAVAESQRLLSQMDYFLAGEARTRASPSAPRAPSDAHAAAALAAQQVTGEEGPQTPSLGAPVPAAGSARASPARAAQHTPALPSGAPAALSSSPAHFLGAISSDEPLYSSRFVVALQEQYENQLSEQRVRHNTLAATNEATIADLSQRLAETEASRNEVERALRSELEEVRRQQLMLTVDVDNLRHSEQLAYREALAALETKHRDELDRAASVANAAMDEQRSWYQQQVRDAELARDAAIRALADDRRALEAELRAYVANLQGTHHEETVQLHRALAGETEALSAARIELHTISEARRREMAEMRDKFEECMRVVAAKEAQWQAELRRAREEAALTQDRLVAERETAERALANERELFGVHRAEFTRKFEKMESTVRAMEQRHYDQARTAERELARMREEHERGMAGAQQALAERADLLLTAKRLEQEHALLGAEMRLVESDAARLRAANVELEAEVRRLDSFVYGRKRAAGAAAPLNSSSSVNTAASASSGRGRGRPRASMRL